MKSYCFLFLILLSSCQNKSSKYPVNSQAKKLNDSAVHLMIYSKDYLRSLELLNEAIKIDSNYFIAYNNKFAVLGLLKPTNSELILETLKKLNTLKPNAPQFYLYIGLIYLKKGDSLNTKKYLTDAISHTDQILDTMHQSNIAYKLMLENKAFCMIISGDEEKGRNIIQQLYNQETNSSYKKKVGSFLTKSRQEIIDSLSF